MFGFHIITDEDKKRLDNLKIFEDVRVNMSILKWAWPEYIREIVRSVQLIQNDMLKNSTKTRDINGLAYSDWASDCCDKIKFELTQVIKQLVVDPNLASPITGKKRKTWKNK